MPHKCTNCGEVHSDNDESILSGCDNCGKAKFQYIPDEQAKTNQEKQDQKQERKQKQQKAQTKTRNQKRKTQKQKTESKSRDEMARQNLNEQFSSIKIVEPGEYELNLVEMFKNEDCVISLLGDGKYTIQLRKD